MADDTNDVEISIQRQLELLLLQSPSNHCIYRIPNHLRKIKRECYQPLFVSIGPYYYQNKTLKSSHELKLRHLQSFLSFNTRTNGANSKSLGHFIEIIRGYENEIRCYYAEKPSLSSNQFIEMVMVDAAFIIYFFMWSCPQFSLRTHPMNNKFDVMIQIQQDLFILENQLPFFVLNHLYDEAFGEAYPNLTFKDVTCAFIGETFFPGREASRTTGRDRVKNTSNIKHLVDFLNICCLPSKLRYQLPIKTENPLDSDEFPQTVKELKMIGVKFVAEGSENLLDITFSEGILRIPTLTLQDCTEAVVRNMSFFEQCYSFHDSYLVDYLFLLDALIQTPEDVQILVQHGIIKHWLGSNEEVAKFFNQITKNLTMRNPGFYYAQLSHDLNEFSGKKKLGKPLLGRDYLNHHKSIKFLTSLVPLLGLIFALQLNKK